MNPPKIIGLSAQLQNGKDTVADLIMKLTSEVNGNHLNSVWKTRKFAGKLKEMTAILLGCKIEELEDINFKNKELGEEWRRWFLVDEGVKDENFNGIVTPYFSSEYEVYEYIREKDFYWLEGIKATSQLLTPRLVLQLLGTEGGRDVIHPNIWVNATLSDLTEKDRVIITDTRFPNEVEGIKRKWGIVVRIIRPSIVSTSTHPSETSLNDYKDWDYLIINDGTLEQLQEKVKTMLYYFNLI